MSGEPLSAYNTARAHAGQAVRVCSAARGAVAASIVFAASPATRGRPTVRRLECVRRRLVSIEPAARDQRCCRGHTLVVKGTCVGNSIVDRSLTITGVRNKPFGSPTLDGNGFSGTVLTVERRCCAHRQRPHDRQRHEHDRSRVRDCGRNRQQSTLTLVGSTLTGNVQGIFNFVGSFTLLRSTVTANTATASSRRAEP